MVCSFGDLAAQSASDFEFSELNENGNRVNRTKEIHPLESGNVLVVKGHKYNRNSDFAFDIYDYVTFELRDENLNFKKEVESELLLYKSGNGDSNLYCHSMVLNGRIRILYTRVKDDALLLYAAELDEKTLILSDKEVLIGTFERLGKKPDYGSVEVVKSENEQHIIFVFRDKHYRRSHIEHIQLLALDADLDYRWDHSMYNPFEEKTKVDYCSIIASDEGEVFVMERRNENFGLHLLSKVDYDFILHKFDDSGEPKVSRALKFDNEVVSELTIDFHPSGRLLVLGFYSLEVDLGSNSGGTIFLSYDRNDLELLIKETETFTPRFLDEGYTSAGEKLNRSGYHKALHRYFEFRDLVHCEDGSVILLAEKRIVWLESSGGTLGNTYSQRLNDILLIRFNTEGKQDWTKKVVKRHSDITGSNKEMTTSLQYVSFLYALKDEKICLFFNDSKKNTDLNTSQKKIKYSSGAFFVVTVDLEGNMDKRLLFTRKEMEVTFSPASSIAVDKNRQEFILAGQMGKKVRFARFKVN